jgi:hypothetical protein
MSASSSPRLMPCLRKSDSGISDMSFTPPASPSVNSDFIKPAPSKPAVCAEVPQFNFDPNSEGPRKLGGGPSYTMSEAALTAALAAITASWTTGGRSIIPLEAAEHFPVGPTPGAHRNMPKVVKVEAAQEAAKVEGWQRVKVRLAKMKWKTKRYVVGTVFKADADKKQPCR